MKTSDSASSVKSSPGQALIVASGITPGVLRESGRSVFLVRSTRHASTCRPERCP